MARKLIISVMAKDRPGIVADVTSTISDLNGNLADISQTVLCDFFTMILVATFPDTITADTLKKKLSDKGKSKNNEFSFEISVKEPMRSVKQEHQLQREHAYILTADAEDQIGLVAKVSAFCRDWKINILDLSTILHDERYTMILLLDMSSVKSIPEFRRKLKEFGVRTGLNIELQHRDIFIATNEI